MAGVRARKSGDAYYIEQKNEKRYDEAEETGTPRRVVAWINAILGPDGIAPCPGESWEEINGYLKDGVILCRLINKILAHGQMPKCAFKSKAGTTFVAMNNVENFNNACRKYGVPDTDLFQGPDLSEGRKAGMINVIGTLNSLGMKANKNGFSPAFDVGEKKVLEN